jgi:hypothetical protein
MTLEQFAEKLRTLLTNANGLAVEGNTIYVFTNERELVAFGE